MKLETTRETGHGAVVYTGTVALLTVVLLVIVLLIRDSEDARRQADCNYRLKNELQEHVESLDSIKQELEAVKARLNRLDADVLRNKLDIQNLKSERANEIR